MYIWIGILLIWMLLGISIILYNPERCTRSSAVALLLSSTTAYCYTTFLQEVLPLGTRVHMFVVTVIYVWNIALSITTFFHNRLQYDLTKGINGSLDKWWNSLTEEEKKSIKDHHTAPQSRWIA